MVKEVVPPPLCNTSILATSVYRLPPDSAPPADIDNSTENAPPKDTRKKTKPIGRVQGDTAPDFTSPANINDNETAPPEDTIQTTTPKEKDAHVNTTDTAPPKEKHAPVHTTDAAHSKKGTCCCQYYRYCSS